MATDQLVAPGSFCWNPACRDYTKLGKHNIIKFGRTRRGVQRYRCTTCKKAVAATKGTVFYGKRHSQETILHCLALLAERMSLAGIHRVLGVKEETVMDWLHEAAEHVQQVEALLLAHHCLSRVQLDALWTYVGHKDQKGGPIPSRRPASSGALRPSTSTVAYALAG
jgi:transposase-like protein